ncbi:MAG: CpaF family protein [Dehalococcoidia bacterium]
MALIERPNFAKPPADGSTSSAPHAREPRPIGPHVVLERGNEAHASPASSVGAGSYGMRQKLHRALIEEIDQAALAEMADGEARAFVAEAVRQLVDREVAPGLGVIRERLVEQLVDDVLGLGPLEPLLRDPSVSEIMVNSWSQVFVERNGRLTLSGVLFRDDAHVVHVIERILAPAGRTIDEASPMVDARLPDGSRVNAVIPPAAVSGPTLTIRKFVADRLTADDLVAAGTLSEASARLLEATVSAGLNVLVSGGTGSGKTTLLNILSSWIPPDQRIITIEDPAELSLRQPHVVSLEARGGSGVHAVHQSELLKNALRMRPDRIIVGEVRGGEAFDMLQAMNTGHEGSMSTVHANSPRDAVRRVENMVLMAGFELPLRAIREQITSALDVVIQVARLRDGSRRVIAVSEVVGMEDQTVTMQDLYLFEHRGVDEDGHIRGLLKSTGLRPSFAERLEEAGFQLAATDGPERDDGSGRTGERWHVA